jgi:hypothetical protein
MHNEIGAQQPNYSLVAFQLRLCTYKSACLLHDAEFTPAWRNTGLPMKPSLLYLDSSRIHGARLVNPREIITEYEDIKRKEVLNPPKVFEYNDNTIEPNYLKATNSVEVRLWQQAEWVSFQFMDTRCTNQHHAGNSGVSLQHGY